ncbi:hypothetical protein SAMN05216436_11045 [bacterium A37T11]|nr:hypothetical protein SAMN05216436_11045 [bacterium A37T11]
MRAEIDHYFANALSLRSELKKLDRARDSNTVKFRSSYRRMSMSYYDHEKVLLEEKLQAADMTANDIAKGFVTLLDQVIRQLSNKKQFVQVTKEESKIEAKYFLKSLYAAALSCLTTDGREIFPVNCEKLRPYRRRIIRELKRIRKNARKVYFHNKLQALRFFESYTGYEASKEWETIFK